MTVFGLFHALEVCFDYVFVFFLFRGSQYVELPYTVKGMDVSFSGILSHIEVGGTVFIGKGLFSEYT